MELLDHSIGDQHLNPRQQCFVLECRDGNGVNIMKIIWLHRPNVIAEAASEN